MTPKALASNEEKKTSEQLFDNLFARSSISSSNSTTATSSPAEVNKNGFQNNGNIQNRLVSSKASAVTDEFSSYRGRLNDDKDSDDDRAKSYNDEVSDAAERKSVSPPPAPVSTKKSAAKKPAVKKKKSVATDLSDDDFGSSKAKKSSAKKKKPESAGKRKKSGAGSSDDDFEINTAIYETSRVGRAKKPVSYNFGDSTDDED